MPAFRTRDTSRSLEVTTDAPQPPTLTIISPTPRAFTFPIAHNLTDSPYSSPSTSPFEPDLRSLALTCTTPPSQSSLIRTLTPITPASSLSSASPSPSSTHNRRKSSSSSDVERRPKKGDEDYIKRPENAFILFRRKCCEDRQQAQEDAAAGDSPAKKQRQADLSKTISQQWKSLSPEERQYWEQLAKEKKKEHEQMYPNYVYRPQRSKDKDGRSKGKKAKGVIRGEFDHETDTETTNVSFVLPSMPRHHGRSASAPTPPPYQSISIPMVYTQTPSCPTSPSLLPMISRRSTHPGHPEEAMSSFDYLPSGNLMPPSFGQAGDFEASLQSSEFLRSMFSMHIPRAEDSLPPLTESSGLLPAHQIVSPASSIGSSSGPSSPLSEPFTPNSTTLTHSFSPLSASSGPSEPQATHDLHMEMQLQQEFEYASYAWETTSMWPPNSDMLLHDDFDIGSIPPIELGLSKYAGGSDELSTTDYSSVGGLGDYSQEYSPILDQFPENHNQHQNLDGLLGFDEVMAGHGF